MRVRRVETEGPPAHLLHRDAGGGDRHVDQAVDGRAVPALAEQRSGADQRAADAALEHARGQLDPGARHPLGARRAERDQHAVRRRLPLGQREVLLGGGDQRLEQHVGVGRQAAQPAAGDHQRPQRRRAAVGAQRDQRVPRGPRGGVEHALQQRGRLGLGELAVAQHEAPQRVAARLHLRRQHLDQPERLGLRAGQQPVDLRGAAADALAREPEAELAERRRHRLVAGGRPPATRAGSAARSPRAAPASRRGRAGGGRPRRAARPRAAPARPSRGSARRRGPAPDGRAGSPPTGPASRRRPSDAARARA